MKILCILVLVVFSFFDGFIFSREFFPAIEDCPALPPPMERQHMEND